MNEKNKRPPELADSKGASKTKHLKNNNTQINRKNQSFDRATLPCPRDYYSNYFSLRKRSGWTNVRCCFHSPDKFASLSLNLDEGHFKCHACDAKGGDVLAFHMQKFDLGFVEACKDLGVWR